MYPFTNSFFFIQFWKMCLCKMGMWGIHKGAEINVANLRIKMRGCDLHGEKQAGFPRQVTVV